MTVALTIAIPDGSLSDFLTTQADRRGCTTRQFVLTLLQCVARDDMADAVLDGEDPAAFAPRAVARPSRQLTDNQVRVLDVIDSVRAETGLSSIAIFGIAERLGQDRGQVRNMVAGLCQREFLEIVQPGRPRCPAVYRISGDAAVAVREWRERAA